MTYQSLYRKYRPQLFEDVVGQKTIVKALSNAITKNKISHAYLFTGPRGTGKTTMAKLFARAINCESNEGTICGECNNCQQSLNGNHPDIVEIDAASNNGVDEIRNLIERVKFTPIVGKYKVYIIDEIHMLTQGAFNALLKTLEEPPEHIVFILATTEIHKVLPTIISRCQRFDFSRISNEEIANRLEFILKKENQSYEEGACSFIASLSGGGMRNALTILEQAMILSDGPISKKGLYESNGMITPEEKVMLFEAMQNEEISNMLDVMTGVIDKTFDIARLVMDLVTGIKDSLILSYTDNLSYTNENDRVFTEYLEKNLSLKQRIDMINLMLSYHEKIRFSSTPSVHFEICLIEIYEMTPKSYASDKNNSRKIDDEVGVIENEGLKDYHDFDSASITTEIMVEDVIEEESSEIINTQLQDVKVVENIQTALETDSNVTETIAKETVVEETIAKETVVEETIVEETIVEETVVEESNVTETIVEDVVTPQVKHDLGLEEIVQFMVSANKEMRQEDENNYNRLTDYNSDLTWAKASRLLNNTKIVLSAESFLVVSTQGQAQAREIMEESNLYDLLAFSLEILGTQKQIFATTVQDFNKAVELFRDLSAKNILPDPFDPEEFISVQEESVQVRDEATDLVLDLFGDSVDIKGS